MKTCIACNQKKTLPKFPKHRGFSDGRRSTCKICYNHAAKADDAKFSRKIYATQKASSTKRGHPASAYTYEEFHAWFVNHAAYPSLWRAYQESGQQKDLAPSADRLDSNKPYTLDNLDLTTWAVNNSRGARDTKTGKKVTQHRKVSAYHLDGTFFKTFASLHEAAREVGGTPSNIQRVADGATIRKPDGRETVLRQTKGYKWVWCPIESV